VTFPASAESDGRDPEQKSGRASRQRTSWMIDGAVLVRKFVSPA
jgi:hypothetical protein